MPPKRSAMVPIAVLAVAGTAGVAPTLAQPAEHDVHVDASATLLRAEAERQLLEARVQAVRDRLQSLSPGNPVNPAEPVNPAGLPDAQNAQASSWTNWPKWSKWSNWANQ